MPFPASDRVIYGKNPLVAVTFVARFSRLLEVDTELPTQFQKKILADYPLLEERDLMRFTLAQNAADAVASPERAKVYDFLSADKSWKTSLASDNIALTVSPRYENWETFRDRLKALLKHFLDVYSGVFVTRIGLRYQNLIVREKLALDGVAWANLFKAHFAGELGDAAFSEDDYLLRQCFLRLRLENGDTAQLTHGTVLSEDTKTNAYRLDGDYYNETHAKAEVDGIIETATRLNANSGKAFRWAISERLHVAMEPSSAHV